MHSFNRNISARYVLVFIITTLSFISYMKGQNQKNPPNFILIYTDDQRQDAAGFNQNDVIITPALDRMAEQGVRFSNANVVFSLCSPSRAALLTGRYGSANGVLNLGSRLNENEISLAKYLKDIGYHTAVSGKWHLGQTPEKLGFDFHVIFHGNGTYYGREIHDMGKKLKTKQHCDEYCVDRSIDFLKEAIDSDRPFFLFQNTQLPHMNGVLKWDAKPETLKKYKEEDMPIAGSNRDDLSGKPAYLKSVRNLKQAKKYGYPDEKAIQKHTKEYYAVITEMDDALGRLFDLIQDENLLENTYVFFMSDNGWMLGEHGFTSKVLPYRPSYSVPMFVLGPGLEEGTNDNLVLNIDILPTILELAQVDIPKNIHGRSFAGLLKGESVTLREAFVYEGLGNYGGTKPNLTVITNKYRYIVTYEDASLEKINYRELYHQVNDPEEMNNLIYEEDMKELVSEFDQYIKEHKQDILKH